MTDFLSKEVAEAEREERCHSHEYPRFLVRFAIDFVRGFAREIRSFVLNVLQVLK